MAASADFKVILTIDSQGNAKIEEVKRGLQDIGDTAAKSSQAGVAGADEFAGALMRKLGVMALVTAGFYKLEQAAVGAFKAGIQAVDDYKLTTIGVAATITDMAADQSKGQENYSRALAYSKDMYNELELAAARYFASGKEMTQAWNILAQKGIVLKHEEIDALGIIVDRIKLSTQGQVSSLQIAQELRSMITGQARATDQVGMLLKDRIPNLEAELEKHRQIGDLVTWLASQFKGLAYASVDIQATLESQKSTLGTLLTQIGRGGLETAYGEIVTLVSRINDYLLTHKDDLIAGVARGWEAVKDLAGGVHGFVKEMANLANKGIVIPITFSFGGLSKWMAEDAGIQALAEGYYGGVLPKEYSAAERDTWNEFSGYETPLPSSAWGPPKPPATTSPKSGKGGGGKGRDTTETLENLLMQLRQEEAKLSDGAFAGIDAWYVKITEKIKTLAMDDQQLKDGMQVATELKVAKEQKVSDDFNKWYLGQMHQTTAAQIAEDGKKLASVKGHAAEEGKAREVMRLHDQERSDKLAQAENQQQKTYYDSLAQASILITDQVFWKEQSWQMEKKISEEQLKQWFIGKDLTESQKENYRGLLALTNASKEYNLERQRAVDLGTLEGWAIERAGEALKRSKSFIKDTMTAAETYLGDVGGNAFVDAVHGKKPELSKMFSDLGDSVIKQIFKTGAAKAFDFLGEAFGGGKPGTPTNPLYVKVVGAGVGLTGGLDSTPAFETEAQKIGYTTGGASSWSADIKGLTTYDKLLDKMYKDESKDLGGISKLKNKMFKEDMKDANAYSKMQDEMIDNNQELFSAKYLDEYQSSFDGMVGNITGVWQVGQGLMTAAGVSGDASRIASMASYSLQAISMLKTMAQSAVFIDAKKAAAAAYAWCVEMIPPPFGFIAGAIAAAAAFAGTMALGQFHEGGVVAHSGLNLDERLVIAQAGEGIIKRDTMAEYARQGITFDMLNTGRLPVLPVPMAAGSPGSGGNPIINISVGDIHVPVLQRMTDQEADKMVRRQIMPAITKELGRFGARLGRH